MNKLQGAWCWGHGVRKERNQISTFPIANCLGERYGPLGASGCRFKVRIVLHESGSMDGTHRANVKAGLQVLIVLKKDQHSGKLTEGIVRDILTKSPTHPHGIKVRLESGEIGRVKKIR